MRGRHADWRLAVAAMMARHAPGVLAILFLALAAHSAQAIWQGARTPQAVLTARVPHVERTPTLTADVGSIVGRHLFGNAVASRADAPPPTRAALVLGGVWYTPDGDAYALIGEPGAPQKPYRSGDRLPAGVELDAVEVDRVLLRREGRAETLALPRAAPAPNPPTAASRLP